jgi:hypothetical protein
LLSRCRAATNAVHWAFHWARRVRSSPMPLADLTSLR